MHFRNTLLNGSMYTPPSICSVEGDGGGGGDNNQDNNQNKPELPAWLAGAQLNEHQAGLLTKKAWGKDTPVTAVLDAYINAEKALGSDRIGIPKGDDDKAGWDNFYKAGGRPDAPDKYDLKGLPEGFDKSLVEGFTKAAHASGLGTKQANAVVQWFVEHGAKSVNDRQANIDSKNELELQSLMTEQGANYKEFTKIGTAAATALGLSEAEVDKLEEVLGTKRTLSMLHSIGKGMKETRFADGNGPGNGGGAMTPGDALGEIARLRNDKDWQKKYQSGDADARTRWKALHAWAYPE
jgi:hypothetical protein